LLLLASTYYYRLYAKAKASPSSLAKEFLSGGEWSPAFWWTGIVWATAATAIHNIQQMPSAKKLDRRWPGTLSIEEDPLAYLGVLVDILEEWDRYSVFKTLDSEPIQGIEVELGNSAGLVQVSFVGPAGPSRAINLRNNFDESLKDWDELIEVLP
jgi:hypothetical protein